MQKKEYKHFVMPPKCFDRVQKKKRCKGGVFYFFPHFFIIFCVFINVCILNKHSIYKKYIYTQLPQQKNVFQVQG